MAKPPYAGRGPRGNARYDLSEDETLAKAGDEDAERRIRTKRYLDTRSVSSKSKQKCS